MPCVVVKNAKKAENLRLVFTTSFDTEKPALEAIKWDIIATRNGKPEDVERVNIRFRQLPAVDRKRGKSLSEGEASHFMFFTKENFDPLDFDSNKDLLDHLFNIAGKCKFFNIEIDGVRVNG